ncbi:MAG: tetratricopeptide repeat protein [Candidatus Omnitrophica bacterium]|nr:tetratricopeptide repeat protein [Candidatus Omnitrophota bacterium]
MRCQKSLKVWVLSLMVLSFAGMCCFAQEAADSKKETSAPADQNVTPVMVQKETPGDPFLLGNDFYKKGEYIKAISEYEKILASGKESAALYYNNANAYFKSGRLGKAILNYERATLLSPRDPDIRSNFKYAESLVKGNPESEKSIWSWGPLAAYVNGFSVNELTLFCSFVFTAFLLFIFIFVVRNRPTIYKITFLVFLFAVILFNALVIWEKVKESDHAAVIVADSADALFGPFETATKFFPVKEGMMVNVVSAQNDWYKIERADGKIGWIKKDVAEKVK